MDFESVVFACFHISSFHSFPAPLQFFFFSSIIFVESSMVLITSLGGPGSAKSRSFVCLIKKVVPQSSVTLVVF